MRFSTKVCAIVSSLGVALATQVMAQSPAPANEEDRLREALRRALDAQTPPVITPEAPPVVPVTPVVPPPSTTLVPPPSVTPVPRMEAPGAYTNVVSVPLSLEEAVRLALVHNLGLQVARYTPMIAEYDRRSLYGVYDPTFSSRVGRAESLREPGGINVNTGNLQPGTRSRTDVFEAEVTGLLPSGGSYGLSHVVNNNKVRTPQFIGTNEFGLPEFLNFGTDTWNSRAGITAVQPLLRDFWIDRARLAIKLGRTAVTISELDLEAQVMTVVNQVEQAYYDLIAARDLVRVREADVTVKKQFFDEQRRRVEVGTLAPLEEKLAQSELALSETALLFGRNEAATAEALLKGLIRENFLNHVNTHLVLTDRLLAVPATFELQNAVEEALLSRPDLQAQRVFLERFQIQLKYDKNQLLPRLDLQGTLGYNGLDTTLGGALKDIERREYRDTFYGVAITLPLTFTAERNNVKSTRAALAQQVVAVKNLEELIIRELENQIRLLRTHWTAIPLTREQVAYAQAALEAEQKKLQAGKSTSYNVLQLTSDLTTAQNIEIANLRDYNKALAELAFRKGKTLDRWRIDPPVRPNR